MGVNSDRAVTQYAMTYSLADNKRENPTFGLSACIQAHSFCYKFCQEFHELINDLFARFRSFVVFGKKQMTLAAARNLLILLPVRTK